MRIVAGPAFQRKKQRNSIFIWSGGCLLEMDRIAIARKMYDQV
jgi:hypothetical protein